MIGIYDNGYSILGRVYDIKKYIKKEVEEKYAEYKCEVDKLLQDLNNHYDDNDIVEVIYEDLYYHSNSYYRIGKWSQKDKVESGWI